MANKPTQSAYRDAGVDIDAQDRALEKIKKLARGTFNSRVLSEIGSFGGLFQPDLAGLTAPVLVASADGVGTKLRVAQMASDYSTVGRDLVNHCVNDILVQGARPLFFLDYVGAGVLEPDAMVSLVEGVAAGCRENGCALLGGETAEMPGFYQPGDYEVVGFIVGLADRACLLDGSRVAPGDVLIGLPSSGLHTNGYSLARRVLFEQEGLQVAEAAPWLEVPPGRARRLGRKKRSKTVGEELLEVHRSYLASVGPLLDHPGLHGLAHVTGGGLTDNLPRILPKKTRAVIRVGTWDIPPIFRYLQEKGRVADEEMFRVFNMGLGMVAAVAPNALREILASLRSSKTRAYIIGSIQKGAGGVVYDLGPSAEDEGDGNDESTGESTGEKE